MNRRRPIKVKDVASRPVRKSLGDRYAELIKLRQAISRTQSEIEISANRRAPIDAPPCTFMRLGN